MNSGFVPTIGESESQHWGDPQPWRWQGRLCFVSPHSLVFTLWLLHLLKSSMDRQDNDRENSFVATAVIKVVWTKIHGQIKMEITTLELIHFLKLQPQQIPNSTISDLDLTHGEFQAHPLSETPSQLPWAHPWYISSSSTPNPMLIHSLKHHRSYPELIHGGSPSSPTSNPELIPSLKQSEFVIKREEENQRSVY